MEEEAMALKGSNILIVDDHVELRSMLKRMLRQMEYFEAFFEARDGEDAWEKLSKLPFDLVICDLDLPRLDGIGLLKRCQTDPTLKNVPFLIVSGEGKQGAVAMAMEMGAYNVLLKPFSFNILKKRIDEIFERFNSVEERLFRHTEQLKAEGRAAEAIEKIEQVERSIAVLKPKWMNLKGEVFMAMEEPERAAQCFEKTIQISEYYLAAYRNFATAQQALGNPEKAVDTLLKADRINPRDIERKLSLGRLMLQAGRTDEGKSFLEQAMRVAPRKDKRAVELKAAEAALESGCFDEAEKLFASALDANPQDLKLYNRLGIALRQQSKYAEAEQCYKQALKVHPDNAIIYYNLGVLHMQTKDLIKAAQSFQRALELDPGFKEAREMLDNLQDIKH
jgi:two-component system chemotaxis response regulator CheY